MVHGIQDYKEQREISLHDYLPITYNMMYIIDTILIGLLKIFIVAPFMGLWFAVDIMMGFAKEIYYKLWYY